MCPLVETHAHLDEIADLDAELDRAGEAGITTIIAVGQDLESNRKILDIAERYPGLVSPALGLHPWNLDKARLEQELEFISANVSRAIAIGEIGLDYHKRVRQKADKPFQKEALSRLLAIAREHDLPALLHSRYAWRDALDLVIESGVKKAVFHWYTGTSSVLRDIIEHGYYISATPAVEYHEEHRRAVKAAPAGLLLLETDCPVVYGRGTENEFESRPADLLRSLRGAAALTGRDEAELAGITSANAGALFRL